ncbi:Integrator complex subunit 4 [Geranomyces variabilis]|uniref:Integrator complex subunit 4 n=1 Tax=Geranomyces variabilis TaxID=109894 RepID=A0AAD5XR74_9FUNG|nr:Integrator complex subunit 4 [Geranomyces variabilis]
MQRRPHQHRCLPAAERSAVLRLAATLLVVPSSFVGPDAASISAHCRAALLLAAGLSASTAAASNLRNVRPAIAAQGLLPTAQTALEYLQLLIATDSSFDEQARKLAHDLITDDAEGVRSRALQLLWRLSMLYRTETKGRVMQSPSPWDLAFAALCGILADPSYYVRAQACVYLGAFDAVAPALMIQALQKNSPESLNVGEGLRKNKAMFDIPPSDVVVDPAACGAFVHGMEDEFELVRNAAVGNAKDELLARCSHTFFVDMFNDEAESVRLNAIVSFHQLAKSQTITLSKEQVQLMSMVLQDSKREIRHAAHQFFGVVRAASSPVLLDILELICHGLHRYAEDVTSVMQCLGNLGKVNADLIEPLVPVVLKLDLKFVAQEANITDKDYVARLVCLVSASTVTPIVFPKFVEHHARYLRDKYPFLKSQGSENLVPEDGPRSDALWITTAKTLSEPLTWTDWGPTDSATIAGINENLRHIERATPQSSGSTRLLSARLRSSALFHAIQHDIRTPRCRAQTRSAAARLAHIAYATSLLYLGLDRAARYALALVRFFAHVAWLVTGGLVDDPTTHRLLARINLLKTMRVRGVPFPDLEAIAASLAATLTPTAAASPLEYLVTVIEDFAFPQWTAPHVLLATTATLTRVLPDGSPLPVRAVGGPVSSTPLTVVATLADPPDLSMVAILVLSENRPPALFQPSPECYVPADSGARILQPTRPSRAFLRDPRAKMVVLAAPEAEDDVEMLGRGADHDGAVAGLVTAVRDVQTGRQLLALSIPAPG